jgi:hypothetical protein
MSAHGNKSEEGRTVEFWGHRLFVNSQTERIVNTQSESSSLCHKALLQLSLHTIKAPGTWCSSQDFGCGFLAQVVIHPVVVALLSLFALGVYKNH